MGYKLARFLYAGNGAYTMAVLEMRRETKRQDQVRDQCLRRILIFSSINYERSI